MTRLEASHLRLGGRTLPRLLLVMALAAGCRPAAGPPRSDVAGGKLSSQIASASDDVIATAQLDRATRLAAHYLARHCQADGRFRYVVRPEDPQAEIEGYNVLRHAGAVMVLAEFGLSHRDAEVTEAALRGGRFLRDRCLAPIRGNRRIVASWSDPDLVGPATRRQAKLGGTALTLAAFCRLHELRSDEFTIEQLRPLARFLLFMQKPSGAFYSKYFFDSGRDDRWQSVYYPGETAYALLQFYRLDRQPQWLTAAVRGLQAISLKARQQETMFPDQWYLMALAELESKPLRDAVRTDLDWGPLRAHAVQLCREMLQAQQVVARQREIAGCFTGDGLSCPTATRLEGLLAAEPIMNVVTPELAEPLRTSLRQGIRFLLSCQLLEGPAQGGFQRRSPAIASGSDKDEDRRASEVRIDYVQHAMAALIGYRQSVTGPAR